jgi:hypothetical protein
MFISGSLNMPVPLTVDVAGFVFDIISLGLSASVLADDNCNGKSKALMKIIIYIYSLINVYILFYIYKIFNSLFIYTCTYI